MLIHESQCRVDGAPSDDPVLHTQSDEANSPRTARKS
jgi:hypothetical protein